MLQEPVSYPGLWSDAAFVVAVNKRLALVSLLGLLIAGGGAGLVVVLEQSHSRSQTQVRRAAEDRAALAAALINSVFAGSYNATGPIKGPVSRARVTSGEIMAARRDSPLTAVFGANGALLASRPALAPATRRLIAGQPAVAAALTDGHHHLSSLLPATAGTPPGFLDVAPFRTRYGIRATVTWLPLPALTALLNRYLRYVANYTQHRARVFLVDSRDVVIGSAAGGVPGRRLADGDLRRALVQDVSGSRFGPGGSRFFAAAGLTVAPWTVVYTTRTSALFASQASSWRLSLLLLAGFLAAAGVCLALLIRLLAGSDKLARANAALALGNDQLTQATEAKSRFVASMAHEVRTPLSAVIGFTELMQLGRPGRVNDTQAEYLGIVRSSADHVLSLINEALDLATVEAGQLKLTPRSCEPALIARQCVSALRGLADARDVQIEVDPGSVGVVSLDPARLRQVILNFLSNAIKFSHRGGRVTVRLAREGERLTIAVSDEGIGISAADQERVFDEFVQLGERAHAGSGLGLAVTRRIVRAQGGEVAVGSRLGTGSTFTARLPWVRPAAEPGPEENGTAGDEQWRQLVADLAPHAGEADVEPAQVEGEWSRAWRRSPRIPSRR
jgi:signal transduction histidine kinase